MRDGVEKHKDGLNEITSKASDSPMPRPMKENGTSSRISLKGIENTHFILFLKNLFVYLQTKGNCLLRSSASERNGELTLKPRLPFFKETYSNFF